MGQYRALWGRHAVLVERTMNDKRSMKAGDKRGIIAGGEDFPCKPRRHRYTGGEVDDGA